MASFSELVLRDYTSRDAAAITKIYAHYVNSGVVSFDLEAPNIEQMKDKLRTIYRARRPLIVAEIDEEVVGYAYASTYRTRPAYRFTCEHALYLAPDQTGKGTGSELFRELIKRSRHFGYHQMIAIITKGSGKYAGTTAASIALHKKFGFETLGEFPELGYKFDLWHDIIHMQKTLL